MVLSIEDKRQKTIWVALLMAGKPQWGKIAAELGEPPSTVRDRYNKLESEWKAKFGDLTKTVPSANGGGAAGGAVEPAPATPKKRRAKGGDEGKATPRKKAKAEAGQNGEVKKEDGADGVAGEDQGFKDEE